MGIATLLMCLIPFYGIKIHIKEANEGYLSIDNANSIKGIFVLAVFIAHTSQYVSIGGGILEIPYHLFDDWIAQCIVAPFLFCSGYGILIQFNKYGKTYIHKLVCKRFPKTLLHFDIAILLYITLNLLLGKQYSLFDNIASFVAWKSIGNSTWFIFASLCLYIICLISGLFACGVSKDSKQRQSVTFVLCIILGSIVYILIMKNLKEPVWYNTIMSFSTGCVFGLVKDKFDCICKDVRIWLVLVIGLAGAYICGILYGGYNFRAPVLTLLIFTVTMRIEINNVMLRWLGEHVFSIYILQRLPMILLDQFGMNNNDYLFFAGSFSITIFISWIFDEFLKRLDRKIHLA